MDRGLFYRPDRSANAAVQKRRRRRSLRTGARRLFFCVGIKGVDLTTCFRMEAESVLIIVKSN
jgi:hypothetical protein